MSNTTTFTTGTGTVLFAAIQEQFATNLRNKQIRNASSAKAKEAAENSHLYSIRIELDSSDPAIETIRNINSAKIDTKANAKLHATNPERTIVNFSTNYTPKVVGVDGVELTGDSIPVFDGRTDQASAVVSFSVIDYGNTQLIRLSGVRFLSLTQAPREETVKTTDVTLDMLKNISS